jgi:hypothetical protein
MNKLHTLFTKQLSIRIRMQGDSMRKQLMGALAVIAVMLAFTPTSPAAGRHPEIEAALDALQSAPGHVVDAKHDYHGHRAEALKHVDAAIHEAQLCMAE